jgi:hypothetical protein
MTTQAVGILWSEDEAVTLHGVERVDGRECLVRKVIDMNGKELEFSATPIDKVRA